MPTFIGMVSYGNSGGKSGPAELGVAKGARAWTDANGGRILSIYWTGGDPDMVVAFEGRDEDQASRAFKDLEAQHGVSIHMVRGLTEGEKERALQGKSV